MPVWGSWWWILHQQITAKCKKVYFPSIYFLEIFLLRVTTRSSFKLSLLNYWRLYPTSSSLAPWSCSWLLETIVCRKSRAGLLAPVEMIGWIDQMIAGRGSLGPAGHQTDLTACFEPLLSMDPSAPSPSLLPIIPVPMPIIVLFIAPAIDRDFLDAIASLAPTPVSQ